jgi:hypothetical protein
MTPDAARTQRNGARVRALVTLLAGQQQALDVLATLLEDYDLPLAGLIPPRQPAHPTARPTEASTPDKLVFGEPIPAGLKQSAPRRAKRR